MGASITLAGERLIAQKHGAQQILTVSRFILANVPGLDPSGPVDRAAGKPAAEQVVGTYDVTQAGYVNPNQVVYSLMLGSDIGDFDWNWIGLETAENVLLMVAYVPTQQKRRNIPPLQVGNNVTRNFLVVFDGAQALTGLTIDASTWQHDFTVRLAGIDERERQSNRDIYGRACFFGSALQLEKVGGVYQLKPGTAYVEGVRLQRSAALPVVPTAFPTTAWLDVALTRELNDVVASWSVVWGTGKVDYVDSAGVQHYCVALAELPNSNTVTDSRPVESIAGPLVAHFAARVGDYAGLRARATTKDDVGLGNLPNAKSDNPSSDSSEILATTAALTSAMAQVVYPLTGMVATFARSTPPAGWLKANGAAVSRTTYAALFAAIGTTYGAGDGSTAFNLPDLRGEFIRGWDNGRGVDANRGFGTAQAGQNESHSHGASIGEAGGHTHTASAASNGEHTHPISGVTASNGAHVHSVSGTAASAGAHTHTQLVRGTGAWDGTSGNRGSDQANNSAGGGQTGVDGQHSHSVSGTAARAGEHNHTVSGSAANAGAHSHTLTVNSVPNHSHNITVFVNGGIEARPRNIALLACIKF
ncbi:phage tail protein [Metapseudomonas otitidis]|uniref:phage tail-collar fiber domain-containing protein n=1 Tax=Metapseudomonas otitidis TaxID=319939 RepID=UPI0013F62EAD|nr:phage tail protein [Pseudomonas otitidis]